MIKQIVTRRPPLTLAMTNSSRRMEQQVWPGITPSKRDTQIVPQQVSTIVDDTDETPPECVKRTVGLHVQCSTVDRLKNLLEYTRHSICHGAATNRTARPRWIEEDDADGVQALSRIESGCHHRLLRGVHRDTLKPGSKVTDLVILQAPQYCEVPHWNHATRDHFLLVENLGWPSQWQVPHWTRWFSKTISSQATLWWLTGDLMWVTVWDWWWQPSKCLPSQRGRARCQQSSWKSHANLPICGYMLSVSLACLVRSTPFWVKQCQLTTFVNDGKGITTIDKIATVCCALTNLNGPIVPFD